MIDLAEYTRTYQLEMSVNDRAAQAQAGFVKHFEDFRDGRPYSIHVLRDWRKSLMSSMKASSRNRYQNAIKTFFRYLRSIDATDVTEAELREVLRRFPIPSVIPKILNRGELSRIMPAVIEHSRRKRRRHIGIGVALALLTGCRPGEVIKMTGEDVDLQEGYIRVYAGKTRRERRVPVDSPILERMLKRLLRMRDLEQRLFADECAFSQFPYFAWREVCDIAKVKRCPPKILRATHIAHVASSHKFSTYELVGRFGHSEGVSHEYYYQPIKGVTGSSIDFWLGCRDELAAMVDDALESERQRA